MFGFAHTLQHTSRSCTGDRRGICLPNRPCDCLTLDPNRYAAAAEQQPLWTLLIWGTSACSRRETSLWTGYSLFSLTCKPGLLPASVLGLVPRALCAAAAHLTGRCQEDGFIVQRKCFYYPISTNVYGDPLWPIVSLPTLVSVFTPFLVFLLK